LTYFVYSSSLRRDAPIAATIAATAKPMIPTAKDGVDALFLTTAI